MQTVSQAVVPRGAVAAAVPRQAEHDDQLIAMWLHGRPATTRRSYRRHVTKFLALTCKPLATVTVGDVQDFADSMAHLAPRPSGFTASDCLLSLRAKVWVAKVSHMALPTQMS